SPEVISSMPAIIRSSVDFPQPDGPTSTVKDVSGTTRSTASTARTPPSYTLLTAESVTSAMCRRGAWFERRATALYHHGRARTPASLLGHGAGPHAHRKLDTADNVAAGARLVRHRNGLRRFLGRAREDGFDPIRVACRERIDCGHRRLRPAGRQR